MKSLSQKIFELLRHCWEVAIKESRVDEWDFGLLGSRPTSAEDSGSNMNQNMGWVP